MSSSTIAFWILCAPLVIAVIDLVRTASALKQMPPSAKGRGAWSRGVHVTGA